MARARANSLKFYVEIDTSRFDRAIRDMMKGYERLNKAANNAAQSSTKIGDGIRKSSKNADELNNKFKTTDKLVSSIYKGVRRLAAIYLGKMGLDALISTMDSLISTQNKLNYLNGQRLGDAGLSADGSGYSSLTTNATRKDMDKIFRAAQESRMGYLDMADNVAKSLTLAGDAFDNNVDQAIKFQKIMSEAYTIGGASAQQKSSSMYQMIQALGSGRLQGDELRSVAEGAQIAYHQIEKYAQELYGTNDALKEMASKGLITSQVVVDAVMSIEDEIDSAFVKTMKTFDQAKTQIKNEAVRAFEPLMQRMAKFLNSERGEKLINTIISLIYKLADVMNFLADVMGKVYGFAEKHTGLLELALLALVPIIGVRLVSAVMTLHKAFLGFFGLTPLFSGLTGTLGKLGTKMGLIAKYAVGAGGALGFVASALGVIGALLAGIVVVCAVFSDSTEDFLGQLFGWLYRIGYAIRDLGAMIADIALGLGSAIVGVAKWAAGNVKNMFINAIYDVIRFANDKLRTAAKLLNLFGVGIDMSEFDKVDKKFARLSYNAFDDQKVFGNVDKWTTTFKVHDPDATYQKGYNYGYNLLGGKKSGIYDEATSALNDMINNAVGDHSAETVSTDDPATKALKETADNTGDISSVLKTATEDLTYLRKVAELEWKRDYTNYNVEIEMNNNNTITKDADVKSITDALAAELAGLASNSAAGLHY